MLGAELEASLEACPTTAIVVDVTGTIVFANAAAYRLFRPQRDLCGLPIKQFLPDWSLPAQGTQSRIVDGLGNEKLAHVKIASWSAVSGTMSTVFVEIESERNLPDTSEAENRLRHIIEILPQAVCVFDAEDRFVLWNRKYAELYSDIAAHLQPGVPFEEILRISLAGDDMQELIEDKETWLRERMEKFRRPVSQEEQQLRDGRWLRHDDRRTPDGGAIGMRIDITGLKQREEWLRQLFDANPMPMMLCDGESLAILQANQAACDFYGYDRGELLSKEAGDMHAQEEAQRFNAAVHDLSKDCDARTVWRQHAADGSERHVLIYVRLLHEGARRRLLLTIADVSDRVAAEAEANRLAHHDVLTGLPNRMQFYKALSAALKSNDGEGVFVLCLDLDGFKPVNDTFGHAAGDAVLKMTADRLRAVGQDHIIARLGGDEFAILMIGDHQQAVDLARRCVAAFDAPFPVRGMAIRIGVSIGLAASTAGGVDADKLVQKADRALYRAKAKGRNTWTIASTRRQKTG
ncbi:diguanylate cyclase [Shinella sp. CPCC 100929]|uniref:Diguanylate cyclase n=1 Tax=Shinella lacus TaxID=2654216 RepID=A0ABT1RFL5_9HYPH|nr:diguanylate cyclase [Shinella lacus]MCQ4633980.1 diguanylate cyclase [Shinella lacus]